MTPEYLISKNWEVVGNKEWKHPLLQSVRTFGYAKKIQTDIDSGKKCFNLCLNCKKWFLHTNSDDMCIVCKPNKYNRKIYDKLFHVSIGLNEPEFIFLTEKAKEHQNTGRYLRHLILKDMESKNV